ncbi:uncharacterized protein LOC110990810 [Acanthaster planci]|uniref:Uncharacterized protein LOC110990810 n=1 Tax=Acanthaster planci TaxID=133434 RepID=A0A8B8A6I3_ACAPL|nr:uncharacterized protein LOC110990810 [Acanthaster planci]
MDLDALITNYFRLGDTHLETVATLSTVHGVALSERTLQRHLQRLGLYRRKNQSDLADVVRFLREQPQQCGQLHGYRLMHRRLLQDDLDKMAEVWDGQRIRKNKQEHLAYGRPLTMFELPQLYNTMDYLKLVDRDRVNVCKEECLFNDNYPCDEDLFNYACLLMGAAGRRAPNTPEEAIHLYIDLRRHLRRALALAN